VQSRTAPPGGQAGAVQLHHLMNAWLMLDPWMNVWQLVHGSSSCDPELNP
jgi:hypothetical protein